MTNERNVAQEGKMKPNCLFCGSQIPHRHNKAGSPVASVDLGVIDKEYFFCTLRCAAKYGVAKAMTRKNLTPDRAALRDEDARRWAQVTRKD